RLHAAGAVELVDGELQPIERELRLERQRSGHRQDVAEPDLLALRAPDGGQRTERGGGADRPQEDATIHSLSLHGALLPRGTRSGYTCPQRSASNRRTRWPI